MKRLFMLVFTIFFMFPSLGSCDVSMDQEAPDPTVHDMAFPLDPGADWEITGPYGEENHGAAVGEAHVHHGVDLAADYGVAIYAAADGVVVQSGWDNPEGYGLSVCIYHGGGYMTIYGHCQATMVEVGAQVKKGDVIAFVGSSGASTGPHLHFQVNVNSSGDAFTGTSDDPTHYVKSLPAEASNGRIRNNGTGSSSGMDWSFDLDFDFAKPIRDVMKLIVDMCTQGLVFLKEGILKILIALLTIELALGAMFKTFQGGEEGFLKWFVYKILFFGILAYFLTHWGDFCTFIVRDLFINSGAAALGFSADEAASLVSDPTMVVQKGMHVVAPIFTELGRMGSGSVLDKLQALLGIWVQTFAVFVPTLIFGALLFVLFLIIGIQIALAYIEFYVVLLFSFTSFLFAGEQHVRRWANWGMNSIFAVSINLMFFIVFAFLLQVTLQNMSTEAIFTTRSANGQTQAYHPGSGKDGVITSMDDLLARMRRVESGSTEGNYHIYGKIDSAFFGAYQICYKDDGQPGHYANWDNWCEKYVADGGTLAEGRDAPGSDPRDPVCNYPWTPENQDAVARYILTGYYNEFGSYEAAARAWNQGTGNMYNEDADEYVRRITGSEVTSGVQKVLKSVINFKVILKIFLVTCMFVFMGDRISNLIMQQFGGQGFRLGNNDGA